MAAPGSLLARTRTVASYDYPRKNLVMFSTAISPDGTWVYVVTRPVDASSDAGWCHGPGTPNPAAGGDHGHRHAAVVRRAALIRRVTSANPDGTPGGTYELPSALASAIVNTEQVGGQPLALGATLAARTRPGAELRTE